MFSLIMYLEKLAWTSGIKSTPFLEPDWLTALLHLIIYTESCVQACTMLGTAGTGGSAQQHIKSGKRLKQQQNVLSFSYITSA